METIIRPEEERFEKLKRIFLFFENVVKGEVNELHLNKGIMKIVSGSDEIRVIHETPLNKIVNKYDRFIANLIDKDLAIESFYYVPEKKMVAPRLVDLGYKIGFRDKRVKYLCKGMKVRWWLDLIVSPAIGKSRQDSGFYVGWEYIVCVPTGKKFTCSDIRVLSEELC